MFKLFFYNYVLLIGVGDYKYFDWLFFVIVKDV